MNATPDAPGVTQLDLNAGRRQQLIDAAIIAIAENGLSGATVARVARVAGLSAGIVNFYFKGKDELLLATLEFLDADFDKVMVPALARVEDDPAAGLRTIVDVFFDPRLSDPRRVAAWFTFWGESRAREDYHRICAASNERFATTVHDLIARLPGIDPALVDAYGAAFMGILDSQWQSILFEKENFERAAAVSLCLTYLDTLVDPMRGGEDAVPAQTAEPVAEMPTLAPWTYRNPAFFDLEMEHIFKRHWLLVGHLGEIPEPGDYLTFDVAGERALVIRDDDGVARAFHNVCRHRGSCLVDRPRGHCERLLVCPFHGWTYGRDGTLRGVPQRQTFPGLELIQHGLVPVELEAWHGFAFVRFGGDGPAVAELTASLHDELAPYRLDEVQPLPWSSQVTMEVNWKLFHDVDNEGYHVPIGHPALETLYGNGYWEGMVNEFVAASYGTVGYGSPYWSVGRYQALLPSFDHLPEARQRVWAYYGFYPNQVMVLYPEMVEFYQTIPLDTGRTIVRSKTYGLPDDRRQTHVARYLNERINGGVAREDERYVSRLGEAMRSSVLPRDRLSTLEAGVAGFHEQVRKALPIARREIEPSDDELRKLLR